MTNIGVSRLSAALGAASVGAMLIASSATAGITDPVLLFTASSSDGTASFMVHPSDLIQNPDGSWIWFLVNSQPLVDGNNGNTIATITQGNVLIIEDPQVSVGFAVAAGNANTTFTITSTTLSFPTIALPSGRATGGMTVTDVNGNAGGVTATGLKPGGSMFSTYYNGFPAGTTFDDLITGPLSAGPISSNTLMDEFPPGAGNFAPIGVPVSDITLEWNFSLTRRDSASGTSTFIVIPTPATLALLGSGVLIGMRRRR